MSRRTILVVAIAAALVVALVGVGWWDYRSARAEFSGLVRAQAASVRDTIAAAARANQAAADEAQSALAERLLDNARLLAELDTRSGFDASLLRRVADRNHLFRLTIVDASGRRTYFGGGEAPSGGRAQNAAGWGAGAGLGGGPGAGILIDRLVRGAETEAVTDLHAGRRTGVGRLAAGVRRVDGGAVIVTTDATEVLSLQQQTSLDRLLEDIVEHTEDVAYLVFEQGEIRRSRGALPPALTSTVPLPGSGPTEREAWVAGRPLLEVTGPLELDNGTQAHVHLGMRLDGARLAERRTLVRLFTSLAAATSIGILALGLVWLHQRYGTLALEHERAQEALRRRDRLTAMGELASTVAHEIRNPLNAIAMSAQRLRREWFGQPGTIADAEREEALALVSVVESEARRINGKVQQFLDFARPPALLLRETPMQAWLTQVLDAFEPLARARGVTLDRGAVDDASATIDGDQLRQAVDNLLRNALDASASHGTITVAAGVDGDQWSVSVKDTGSGIAPEHLARIFDLYFTTKPDGTGVGLPVTQQVVVAHGGRLDVESVRGVGTTMRIVLPGTASHA